jgi:Rieske Fe-S protein
MRARVLVALTAVAILLVTLAGLRAIGGHGASSSGTSVNVSRLGRGEVLPVRVTLPDAEHTKARVFLVRPTGRPVMALLGISTHLGCRLLFPGDADFGEGFTRVDALTFEDPCGGSTFTLDGRCVGGPCPRDLDRYAVEVAAGIATFDLHDLVRGPPRGSS